MKRVIGTKIYKSNGKFYEFYQFDDLPKTLQNELKEFIECNQYPHIKESIECNQYIHIGNNWYGVDEFLITYHNPWLGSIADDYHNNDIHGLLASDFDIAIEINNTNDGYRSWIA